MQILTIEGRLGRDAKLKESTSGGRRFITFTVAVNSKVRGAEKTTWYEVISFNEMYFDWTKYLTKGSSVAVTGDLDLAVQEGTDGITRLRASINAFKLDFPVNSNSGETASTETKVEKKAAAPKEEDIPEDIPMSKTSGKKKAEKPAAAETATESEDDLPF